MQNTQSTFQDWLLRVYVLLIVVFILAPILAIMSTSFTQTNYIAFPPKGFTLSWYARILDSQEFIGAFVLSFKVAAIVALCSCILGTAAAFAVHRYDFRGREAVTGILTAPLVVPTVVLAIGLLQMLARVPVLAPPFPLIAAHVVVTIPYVLRLVLGSLTGMDANLERAAAGLGATPPRIFWRIVLPQVWTGIAAGTIFAFIVSFDDAALAVFLVGAGGATLPVQIFNYITFNFDPLITAVGSVAIILSVAAAVIIERLVGLGQAVGAEADGKS